MATLRSDRVRGLGLLALSLLLMGLIVCAAVGQNQPAQPGTQPGQPAQPGTQPGQPGTQPGQPAQPGTQPSQPTQPGTQPTQPGTQPAQPGTQPAQPATQPEQPAQSSEPPLAAPVKYEDPLPVAEGLDTSDKKREIIGILRNGTSGQQEEATLREYYGTYALPRWTDPDHFVHLADYREDLGRELKYGKSGPAHDLVVQMVLDFMRQRINEHRPPVVRFNAMLAIADLNRVDSASASTATVPLPEALDVLREALRQPDQIDVVKLAALVGIRRHALLAGDAQNGLGNPQVRAEVIKELQTLATTKAVPKRSVDGHAWMRQLAITVLAALGDAGPQGQIADTVAAIVTEDPPTQMVRCEAATALGYLDYASVANLDSLKLALTLAQMAADACEEELQRYEEAKEKGAPQLSSGYGTGMMGPMMGPAGAGGDTMGLEGGEETDYYGAEGGMMGMGGPPKPKGLISQRLIKTDLAAILTGLRGPDRKSGVGNVANQKTQEVSEEIVRRINLLVRDLDDEESDDEDLVEAIETAKADFEKLIQEQRGGAAPARPATAPPGNQASS